MTKLRSNCCCHSHDALHDLIRLVCCTEGAVSGWLRGFDRSYNVAHLKTIFALVNEGFPFVRCIFPSDEEHLGLSRSVDHNQIRYLH